MSKPKSRILSFLLAAALILTALPMTMFAEGDIDLGASGNLDGFSAPTHATIVATLDKLDDEVLYQGFDVGTITLDDLTLPGTLYGEDAKGSALTVGGVAWSCVSAETMLGEAFETAAFAPDAEGVYLFAPALPEGYVLADGVSLPIITVTIRKRMRMMRIVNTTVSDLDQLNTAIAAFNGNSDDMTITVGGIIHITSILTISGSGTLTITSGEDGPYTLTRAVDGDLVTVNAGAHLVLEDIAIDGNGDAFSGTGSLIVLDGGDLTLNSGTISGNKTTGSSGYGGVRVKSGAFIMNGGKISGNTASAYGGGVYVASGAFTMSGGEISGNTVKVSGGGVYIYSGTFEMDGGTISDNSASRYGGGVSIGKGVPFTMSGSSSIRNNKAIQGGGGVFVGNGTFTMISGEISGNIAEAYDGGGVYVSGASSSPGIFNMSGGTVSGNTATDTGDGVYFLGGTLQLSGTPQIVDGIFTYDALLSYIEITGALTSDAKISIAGSYLPADEMVKDAAVAQNSSIYPVITDADASAFCGATHDGKPLYGVVSADKSNVIWATVTLGGTVTIDNTDPKTGDVLTADTSGLTTLPSGFDPGTLTYQWKRGDGTPIGANSNTYTVTPADIGKNITVTVTAEQCDGSVSSTATAAVATDATPAITWPTAGGVSYGQTLANSTLSFTGNAYGTFAWTAPATIPTVGNTGYSVTFTPSSDTAYDWTGVTLTRNVAVAVTPKNASALTIDAIAATTYTGSAQEPVIAVKDGAATLTNGTDYTVAFSNNTDAGTAAATISGIGNYTGTKSENFIINKAALMVGPKSVSVVQGGAMPTFELEYRGLIGGESVTPNDVPAFICEAANTGAAGSFAITWTNMDIISFTGAGNYAITKSAAGTLTITSNNSDDGSGGGGSASGGSSTGDSGGGSSLRSAGSATVQADSSAVDVSASVATTAAKSAVEQAQSSGAATAAPTLRNPGNISLDVLQAMTAEAGMPLRLRADTLTPDGTAVDVRITLDPAQSTQGLNLSASAANTRAKSITDFFRKWFRNELMTVSFGQQGSFGQTVEIATRVDPGLDTANLVFYAYDSATNTYTRLAEPKYWVDANGYLRFYTAVAGDILISAGSLAGI